MKPPNKCEHAEAVDLVILILPDVGLFISFCPDCHQVFQSEHPHEKNARPKKMTRRRKPR